MKWLIPAWENGALKPLDKVDVHRRGLRHKAISIFVTDGDRVLLQKRASVKYHTPAVLPEFESQLAGMDCTDPDHAQIRDILLGLGPDDDAAGRVAQALGRDVLESVMSGPHVSICPAVRYAGDAEQARLSLQEVFGKLTALPGLNAEIAEAEEEITGLADEAVTWRLREAAEARNRALRSQQEDKTSYEMGPNGMMIDKDERSAFDALLDKIGYSKPRR